MFNNNRKLLYRFTFLFAAAVFAALAALTVPNHTSAAVSGADGVSSADGVKVTMNGTVFRPKSAPFVNGGTVYLPVRDIGDLLGTSVSWNASTKTVAMHYPQLDAKLVYGSATATVNGRSVQLTALLRIVDGRVFVPLRFFSEATGADIKWDGSSKTVSISKADDLIRQYGMGIVWLNKKTGDLYRAKDDQSPAIRIGALDAELKGEVTLQAGYRQGGIWVLTVVDQYGEYRDLNDAYGLLIHNNRIVAQKKAAYEGRYEPNATGFQIYDPNGWIQYTVLTDGKIITVYDKSANPVKEYNVPELAGEDGVYSVQAIGNDYLVVRPNRTGLLMLVDLKDHSVVTLADKLLTGKDLDYARSKETPNSGDGLHIVGDMGYGVLDFFYVSPLSKTDNPIRLSYYRPSYKEERNALPKDRKLSEMAAGCSPDTVESVDMQEGDQLYVPLIGADADDRGSIIAACGILKKFASNGTDETLKPYFLDTFYHGMYIRFKKGDGISIFQAGGDKLAIGSGDGGRTLVLKDAEAVRDFERLKVLPTLLTITPNPAHFGEKIHFEGNNGDSKASAPFVVTWRPILNHYSSSDPDPSLVIYTGTTTFGRYDVTFAMPAYGKAADGTLKPILPGKGWIDIPGLNGGPFSSTSIDLLPASQPFLSVDGFPAADPSLMPITVSGRVLVPVRALAVLAGQPIVWDAESNAILIRTKPTDVAPRDVASAYVTSLWIDGKKATNLQPIVRGGTAYVPIRAVTEAFGLPVVWDSRSRSVNVTTAPAKTAIKP